MNALAGADDEGSSFHVGVSSDGSTTVVRPAGEIDMATAPELEACLTALAGEVVVDLGDVSFLDSTGLAALIRAKKRLQEQGGELRVRNPQPHVRRVFEITHVGEWLDLD